MWPLRHPRRTEDGPDRRSDILRQLLPGCDQVGKVRIGELESDMLDDMSLFRLTERLAASPAHATTCNDPGPSAPADFGSESRGFESLRACHHPRSRPTRSGMEVNRGAPRR